MSSVYNHVYGGVFVRVLLLYRFQALANHIWSHHPCLNASTAAISLVPRPVLPLVFDHALAICRNWRRGRPRVAAASGQFATPTYLWSRAPLSQSWDHALQLGYLITAVLCKWSSVLGHVFRRSEPSFASPRGGGALRAAQREQAARRLGRESGANKGRYQGLPCSL